MATTMTEETIIDAIKDVTGYTVTTGMSLNDAGLDSLDLVNVIIELEGDHAGVIIPDAVAENAKTVQEFVTGCLQAATKT